VAIVGRFDAPSVEEHGAYSEVVGYDGAHPPRLSAKPQPSPARLRSTIAEWSTVTTGRRAATHGERWRTAGSVAVPRSRINADSRLDAERAAPSRRHRTEVAVGPGDMDFAAEIVARRAD
jgi:hypothetical protein